MAKVFVSYSRKDITFAKRLTAELQKCELDFWIDWEGIPPTVDWWREIEKGIEEADIFLFLISPDSARSKVCGQEIETAAKNGKRIIPIVVRHVAWEKTPKNLRHLNYIFFREEDDFEASVNKLITAIQTDYEWAATHRRLQVKALEWERENKENSYLLRGLDLLDAEQDLATNSSKEPHPTDLQREYVFESRKATDRQRKITTWLAIFTAVALAALAGFGFYQADVAKEQANIALSGKLAAQAEILIDKDLQKALLLGIESNRILESNHVPMDALSRGTFLDVVNTNLQLFQFLSPDEPANEVAFSPTGKILASVHGAKIILWDIAQGKRVRELESKDSLEMHSVAYSPDGDRIAAGACHGLDKNGISCNKGVIILWETETYQQTGRLSGDILGDAPRIVFSPDGRNIASITSTGGREATVSVWDIQTGSSFEPEVNKDEILSAISFSRDGKTLALGGSISYLSLWDVVKHRKIRTIGEGNGIPGRIFFSPDGKLMATSGGVLTPATRFWDTATGEPLETIPGEVLIAVNEERDIQLTRDLAGKLIVWKGYWDKSKREAVNELPLDPLLYRLFLSPDGRTLAEINNRGNILLWDTTTGADRSNYRILPSSGVPPDNIAFTADSNTILSVGYGELLAWNVSSNNGPTSKTLSDEFDFVLAISSDATSFLARDYDSAYTVRDTAAGQRITKLQTDQLLLDIAVLSNDNKIIATSSCAEYDRMLCIASDVTLWDADNGTRLEQQFGRSFSELTSIAFHPDNEILAISDRGTIHLWDVSNYQLTRPSFTADVTGISHLTFSPDGEILAAIANDRNSRDVIVLWDVKTGEAIGQPLVGAGMPLAFSPDGKILASGHVSEDGTSSILLWDMDIQSWKAKSCQRAGRNLTRDEWAQYLLDLPYPTNPEDATCPQWPLDGETTSAPGP